MAVAIHTFQFLKERVPLAAEPEAQQQEERAHADHADRPGQGHLTYQLPYIVDQSRFHLM